MSVVATANLEGPPSGEAWTIDTISGSFMAFGVSGKVVVTPSSGDPVTYRIVPSGGLFAITAGLTLDADASATITLETAIGNVPGRLTIDATSA